MSIFGPHLSPKSANENRQKIAKNVFFPQNWQFSFADFGGKSQSKIKILQCIRIGRMWKTIL
jgi:hypothetical protein